MDARKFMKEGGGGTFLRKIDLRRDGPRDLVIDQVEERVGKGNNGTAELQLRFADNTRLGLRTEENLRRLIRFFGNDTEAWIGKTVRVYFSPDVPNPSGGEPGGIRVQLPEDAPAEYVSDLDESKKETGAERTAKFRSPY